MAEGGMNLEQQFVNFSQFGDPNSDGKTITLTQADKWFKQAQVIGKQITPTDTGISFNKFKLVLNNYYKILSEISIEHEQSIFQHF